MISGSVNNWYDAWEGLHLTIADNPNQAIDQRFASRAVIFDTELFIRTNELGKLHHSLVGYTSYKLNLFDRNYIIPGLKESVAEKLKERARANKKLTIISYPFNIDNKAHDQGPCVINITITMMKRGSEWHTHFRVNMRIAEITKRLLVDFIKFSELIDYWSNELREFNPQFGGITFYSSALYAQSLFAVIAEQLPDSKVKFDKDHWFHIMVQKQYAKFDNPNFKMKMGKRVKRHLNRLKEGES